jgi:hypothetical protein
MVWRSGRRRLDAAGRSGRYGTSRRFTWDDARGVEAAPGPLPVAGAVAPDAHDGMVAADDAVDHAPRYAGIGDGADRRFILPSLRVLFGLWAWRSMCTAVSG